MNRRTWIVLAVAAMIAGCASPPAATPAATPTANLRADLAANFPSTDGSTTAFPLTRLMACDLLAVPCVWSAPASENVERTYVPDPAAQVSEANKQAILGIKFNTTHAAYVNLINGTKDVILEARLPSPDEIAEAKARGVALETKAFALDAFVFLVNAKSPVSSLPLVTLRDVYAGRIKTWKDAGIAMGDPAALIHAYQRERNSGSQELLVSMVMNGAQAIDAPDMIVKLMVGPYNALGGDAKTGAGGDVLGLGYSVYYYATVMFSNPQVKMIGVDGIVPNAQTIAARTYPLAAEVYVVTRAGTAATSPAGRFRDWLLSADGQRVVQQSGYVPIARPG